MASKGSTREPTGRVENAIAIDADKNSQSAVKWAVENILKKSPNCVLIHVKTQNLHPNDIDYVPKEGRPPTDEELKMFFLPFRGYCARKGLQVYSKEIILHDVDVPSALTGYVTNNSISHLVVGASTKISLLRKFSSPDVGKVLMKSVPDSCTVYIVAKDKLQTVRHAKTSSQSSHSSVSMPFSNSNAPAKTLSTSGFQMILPVRAVTPDTYDVNRSPYSFGGRLSTSSESSSSVKSNESTPLGSHSRQRNDSPLAMPMESYLSKSSYTSSTSGLSDFSLPLSFQSSNRSSGAASSSPGNSRPSISHEVIDNIDDEMTKLQLEFKQSLTCYDMACQDAANAELKARDIQHIKTSQLQSFGDGRPPKEGSWSNSMDLNKMDNYFSPASNNKKEHFTSPRIDVCYRRYSVRQIEEATDHFSNSRKIGEGGYGPVYLATLDNTTVAIKALRSNVSQGLKQFQQEVEVLSGMRHPNMVLLVGACPEYGCLVYEYMDYGNLEDRLFCKDGTPPIPWHSRFKIAAEIATGLAFLHHTKPEPVVHRDIKPSNILLDSNYKSKISDVGLARLVPASTANMMTSCHMTAAAGTFCYIDPEYQQSGMLGVKSDVYSFGVVLLQLITAKQPMGLAMQVEDAIEEGTFPEILDPTVRDWPLEETLSLAKLAIRCCELRKKDRPDLASEIIPELIKLRDLGIENGTNRTMNGIAIPNNLWPDVIDMETP